MENQAKRPLNRKLIAGVAALVVVVAALLAVYFFTRPAATAGDKTITATVVGFHRIREYLGLSPKRNLKELGNGAINSTLSRTINTSGTTLVTLLAIFFFGGETIRGFIFALIIGVVVGTAATIFIATPIAYDLMIRRAAKAGEEK